MVLLLLQVTLRIVEKLMVLGSAKQKLVNHPKGIETLVNMVFKSQCGPTTKSKARMLHKVLTFK
ncbi:unnamed protein product [Lupinus luteus]|uniref:Uncharacterized protein n=1 Tax=Lupinus luteus TaxID=3873 RepID=A0AAV1Y7S0_LUPLU